MKMQNPTGVVDEETAKAVDEFGSKYSLNFEQIKCDCSKKCGGFGKGRYKGEYRAGKPKDEAYNMYEYPGIHRSLLWGLRGLCVYLEKETFALSVHKLDSGYRCHDNNAEKLNSEGKPRTSTNHMGKAIDIHIATKNDKGVWHRPTNKIKNTELCDKVRKICQVQLGAQIRWAKSNIFSLEPSTAITSTEAIADSWVHIDVRTFEPAYLNDKFFAKDIQGLYGKLLNGLLKG